MVINNAVELLKLVENNQYLKKDVEIIFDKTIKGEYCLPIEINNISIQIDFAQLVVRESHHLNWLQYAYLLRYLILNNPMIITLILNHGSCYGNYSLLFKQIFKNKFLNSIWYYFYCAHSHYFSEIFFKRNTFNADVKNRNDIFFNKLVNELVDYYKYLNTDFVDKQCIYENYKICDDIVHQAEYQFYNIDVR